MGHGAFRPVSTFLSSGPRRAAGGGAQIPPPTRLIHDEGAEPDAILIGQQDFVELRTLAKRTMSQPPRDSESPSSDGDSDPSRALDAQLHEISKQLPASESELLEELGIYSIHDQQSCRTLTLPAHAEEFDDVTNVKQFYVDDGERPMLIIVPLTI